MHVTNLFHWIGPHPPEATPASPQAADVNHPEHPAGLIDGLRARMAHLGESEDEHYLEEAQDLADLEHRQRHLEHDGMPPPELPPV